MQLTTHSKGEKEKMTPSASSAALVQHQQNDTSTNNNNNNHQSDAEPAAKVSATTMMSHASLHALLEGLSFVKFPFDAGDHYGLPVGRVPVVVRDGELSSIVAYALSPGFIKFH